ncbi:asparaginase [Murinocardiopsis flavida]|uniref:Asparaginase n=1 Tax=Murinocardiopsis flavida TaxID=645275 RepID=A0A2P8D4Y0_9ACTN|nr:asparaginase [Murinocardiopsis flavida]PSK92277.1 asparaginase [Murinocardiopsis flavida]
MTDRPLPSHVPVAEVVRSGFREGVHYGSVAGLSAAGELDYARGGVEAPMLPRSSAKPFQALACLRAGAPLSGAALAIAAGSHTGTDAHVETVEKILRDSGIDASALGCPPDRPLDPVARTALRAAGAGPARVRMNCSGKHAAMLAACVRQGWSTADYLDPEHPLQLLVRATIEELCGETVAHTTVDGCGAPQFAISLLGLARGMRAMALAPPDGDAAAVLRAMREHPASVAGEGRDDTVLMRRLPGVSAKSGAEGVIVMTSADGRTTAVKISDGDPLTRSRTMVALTAMAALGVDTAPAAELTRGAVLGKGEPVGEIRPI